jgi:serine/threonine protein kinase
MPPEYAIDGIFSVKSDVYSFGVLVLEIVSGKRNRGFYHPDHNLNLLGHVSDVNKYKLLFSFEFCPFFLVPFTVSMDRVYLQTHLEENSFKPLHDDPNDHLYVLLVT